MKNEIRGFLFLAFAIICFCTHEICDKLFWITAYLSPIRPATGSIAYGGIILIAFTLIFFVLAFIYFVKAYKSKNSSKTNRDDF